MTTINETNDNPVRLSIGMRINQVRKQVEYIKKEKRVAAYKAVEHDQVTAMLRPSLIEHGIITVVKEIKGELASTEKQTDKGVPITAYIATYEIDFCCDDDTQDKITATVSGIGEDYGDKGPGKAISYAVKTALLKTFNIETGISDESRIDSNRKKITEQQLADIETLRTDAKIKEDEFKVRLNRKFETEDIKKLSKKQADELIKLLGTIIKNA